MSKEEFTTEEHIMDEGEQDRAEEKRITEKEMALLAGENHTLDDYYALPDDLRVELIDGKFFIMEVPTSFHQLAAGEIHRQIQNFIVEEKGKCLSFISPVDVRLDCDDRTMVQPDVIIVCDRDKIRRWGIMGAPDFVLEVLSPSTSRKDSVLKLKKYLAAGVKEYWLLDPEAMKLTVFSLAQRAEKNPEIYELAGKVPVALYDGRLQIDLDMVGELIREFSK